MISTDLFKCRYDLLLNPPPSNPFNRQFGKRGKFVYTLQLCMQNICFVLYARAFQHYNRAWCVGVCILRGGWMEIQGMADVCRGMLICRDVKIFIHSEKICFSKLEWLHLCSTHTDHLSNILYIDMNFCGNFPKENALHPSSCKKFAINRNTV